MRYRYTELIMPKTVDENVQETIAAQASLQAQVNKLSPEALLKYLIAHKGPTALLIARVEALSHVGLITPDIVKDAIIDAGVSTTKTVITYFNTKLDRADDALRRGDAASEQNDAKLIEIQRRKLAEQAAKAKTEENKEEAATAQSLTLGR